MIPDCPDQLPEHLTAPLHQFARSWVESPLRPRVTREVARAWDHLVEEWIGATTLPLYIRKSSAKRGEVISHHTGRPLIPCDNTTAVWAFTLAIEGVCPTISEAAAAVRNSKIPFTFTGLRGRFAQFYSAGWKLAHIEDVGLRTRERLENIPIAVLEDHFRRLVLPSNMFAIPKIWAGLGGVPEIIDAIRASGEHEPTLFFASPSRSDSRMADQGNGRYHGSGDGSRNGYRATRLLFKANVIERLTDDQAFRIETPEGTYEMTKAQFRNTFPNVTESDTYRRTGVYSYNRTPEKARQYMLRST